MSHNSWQCYFTNKCCNYFSLFSSFQLSSTFNMPFNDTSAGLQWYIVSKLPFKLRSTF